MRWWTALLVLGLLGIVLAALRLAGGGAAATLLGALTFAAIAAPSISAIALGQAAMLSAGGIAVALLAFERRSAVAAVAATIVAAIQPNLALGLAWRMRDRFALPCAAVAAVLFATVTLIAGGGIAGFTAYANRLRAHGNAEALTAIQHTTASIASAFGEPQPAAAAIGIAVAIAATAAVLAHIVTRRLSALDGTLLGLAALPLAIPFFHEHDFAVELIPLLILAIRAAGTARAVAGAAAVLILVDWFGLAQRGAGQAQILALGIAVALGFAACRRDRAPGAADLAPLAALAVVACAAIPLANVARAPIWPDGLPPAYRAPAGADASGVWADEQRAAGLTVLQPAWGALRALPLAGCVVLGAAIVLGARRR